LYYDAVNEIQIWLMTRGDIARKDPF